MKSITQLVSIAFLFMLFSCQTENGGTICLSEAPLDYPPEIGEISLCETDTCMQYFPIWKELFLEKNDLDQEFFDNHIEVYRTSVNHWMQGISFRVCYQVQIDWAIAKKCDSFIINIEADDRYYPLLDLPRNVNLSPEDVETVVDKMAFSSEINELADATIQYPSLEAALDELIAFSGVNILCFSRLKVDRHSGNLVLEAIGKYENLSNACIKGSVDLMTGEMTVFDTVCAIIN